MGYFLVVLIFIGIVLFFCTFAALSIAIISLSRKVKKQSLQITEFKNMPENNPNPVIQVDKNGVIHYFNSPSKLLLQSWGIKKGDTLPREYVDIAMQALEIGNVDTVEMQVNDAYYLVAFAPTNSASVNLYFTDVSELELAKKQVEEGLTIEPYSGLPNRFMFYQTMKFEIQQANQETKIALLMIMLEDWYEIIGSCGVDNTEEMFRQAYQRITSIVGKEMFISRVGEREFVLVNKQHIDVDTVSQTAAELIEMLTSPYHIGGHEIKTMVSIGITFYPDDAKDEETLLRNAHLALSRASASPNLPSEKQIASKTHYEFFQRGMLDQLHQRRHIITDLYKAIPNGEFELFYQPKISMKDHQLISCEALLRWNHPKRGLIAPNYFLNVAEQYELIHIISEWVISTACSQIVKWHDQGHKISVAVNLSPRQLHHEGIVEEIDSILKTHKCPPEYLELEITESSLIDDVEASIEIMRALHDLGVSIAIDDFGTGYSSLSYLMQFPASVIKIDRSFVKEINKETGDDHICRGIIDLGHSLNMKVVAEGVETKEQITYLRKHSVDMIQGYVYSQPVPTQEFDKFFDQQWH